MSKAILISIKPDWVAKILNGEKTIEIRKSAPKCELPIEVYVYCTKGDSLVYSDDHEDVAWSKPYIDKANSRVWVTHGGRIGRRCKDRAWNGKVVAKFTLKEVEPYKRTPCECNPFDIYDCEICRPQIELCKKSCTNGQLIANYAGYTATVYAWHISDLVIFNKPMELGEFKTVCRPTQECADCNKSGKYGCNKLTRPPQSWQHVEVQNEKTI